MRKKSIVAAALLCILIIGITSLYLAGCSNTAKETAVLEEAGTAFQKIRMTGPGRIQIPIP